MSPATLGALSALSIGAGVLDVSLLNLVVVPALTDAPVSRGVEPVRAPPPVPTTALPVAAVTAANAEREPLAPRDTADAPALAVLPFRHFSCLLDRAAANALRERLSQLHGADVVRLVGHADARGPETLNQRLSADRADAVARELVRLGVPRARLRLEGRGEREPLANGNSRRVEIFVGGKS